MLNLILPIKTMNLNDFAPQLVTAIITGVFSAVSIYVAMSNRLTVLETKVDAMTKQLEALAALSADVSRYGSDIKTLFERVGKAEHDIERLEEEVYHGDKR